MNEEPHNELQALTPDAYAERVLYLTRKYEALYKKNQGLRKALADNREALYRIQDRGDLYYLDNDGFHPYNVRFEREPQPLSCPATILTEISEDDLNIENLKKDEIPNRADDHDIDMTAANESMRKYFDNMTKENSGLYYENDGLRSEIKQLNDRVAFDRNYIRCLHCKLYGRPESPRMSLPPVPKEFDALPPVPLASHNIGIAAPSLAQKLSFFMGRSLGLENANRRLNNELFDLRSALATTQQEFTDFAKQYQSMDNYYRATINALYEEKRSLHRTFERLLTKIRYLEGVKVPQAEERMADKQREVEALTKEISALKDQVEKQNSAGQTTQGRCGGGKKPVLTTCATGQLDTPYQGALYSPSRLFDRALQLRQSRAGAPKQTFAEYLLRTRKGCLQKSEVKSTTCTSHISVKIPGANSTQCKSRVSSMASSVQEAPVSAILPLREPCCVFCDTSSPQYPPDWQRPLVGPQAQADEADISDTDTEDTGTRVANGRDQNSDREHFEDNSDGNFTSGRENSEDGFDHLDKLYLRSAGSGADFSEESDDDDRSDTTSISDCTLIDDVEEDDSTRTLAVENEEQSHRSWYISPPAAV